ncbi:MAG: hypothetical protein HGB08_03945 [Candidatus Moranbacteria bacterium]|nr:hypothetical protein [Candidatus Moranbacteria bacterium]
MAKNGASKKISLLEPSFRDILVCRNNDNKPFLEAFHAEPENVSLEKLGTLFGFFEITDHSEDSSYIVNYLISVIKKEFFLRPGRGSVESFEAALHKVNLALSKLAAHENVKWIGNLNSVCAVIEKNNLHIASAGSGNAFFLRSKTLTELTDPSENSGSANPLRTFQDVLSGRMEEGDKIILATQSIFDIFSIEEIKKSALKFSREEFARFLNTALVNELDSATVILADMDKKGANASVEAPEKEVIEEMNAFAQTTYAKKRETEEPHREEAHISPEEKSRLKEEIQELKDEFVDKRTGHIYIKETAPEEEQEEIRFQGSYSEMLGKITQTAGTKLKNLSDSSKSAASGMLDSSRLLLEKVRKNISKKKEGRISSIEYATDETPTKENYAPQEMAAAASLAAIAKKSASALTQKASNALREENFELIWKSIRNACVRLAENLKPAAIGTRNALIRLAILIATISKNLARMIATEAYPAAKRAVISTISRFKHAQKSKPETAVIVTENISAQSASKASIENFSRARASRTITPRSLPARRKMIPDFKKLRNIIGKLNYQQRLYLILLVMAFFIVPYWIVKLENRSAEKKPAPAPAAMTESASSMLPLQNDKNVTRIEKISKTYSGEDITNVINLNGKFFSVSKTDIVSLETEARFPIPDNFQNAEFAAPMDDLGIIFLMKGGRVTSFSPASEKFSDNSLSLPASVEVRGIGSYLTYLYVLDAKAGQIYRYPRAEGGFGDKSDWLKDTPNLSGAQDMAINDNVFIISNGRIIKFFRGKSQDFSPEKTATEVIPEKLYTNPDSENIYALDTKNARIVKYDKDGNLVSEFYNAAIENADNFSVDEKNSVVYFSTENAVNSFGMEG